MNHLGPPTLTSLHRSLLSLACFLECNPWTISALLRYMLKAAKDGSGLAPDDVLGIPTHTVNPK
jgi:hypothetical protein